MAIDPYLIPGTKTLQNKLGITDSATLSTFERKFTSARDAAAITNPAPGNLDFDHLKYIHKNLFQDVYEWAGQVRTVNIAKGEAFAPMQNIDSFAKSTFDGLKADNYLQGLPKDQFLDRAAHHLGEINALHPFRDGNGRAQRAFMDQVAGRAGYAFDWSKTNQREMIDASIHSFNVDPSKMRALLEKTLVEPLKQRDRQQRLNDLAANDPKAHATIVDVRQQLLGLSEKNIADPESRENLANAVTDRLLNHHEQGHSVDKLVAPPQPKIDKDKGPLGR